MRRIARIIISLIFLFVLVSPVNANSTPSTTVTPSTTPIASPTIAQVKKYDLSIAITKSTVSPEEFFDINVTVKNSGNQPYSDFEIRAPFVNTIKDVKFLGESPSFNRLLESYEYPAGFQSRSWIINNFNAGDTRTFKVSYQVAKEPQTPNGLLSIFTLPASWVDPAGLPSASEQSLGTIRFDVYLNKTFSKSIQVDLPKLGVLNTDISLITLNSKFYFTGSKSTKLNTINKTNISAYTGFMLETKDVLIEWLEPIDFSGSDVAGKLRTLDSILGVDWGRVSYKKDQASFLEKKVRITFKDTPYVFAPRIRVGSEIKEIENANGTFVSPDKKTVLTPDKLDNNFGIVPNISTEQSVIETSESRMVIEAKTCDPNTQVSYSINNGPITNISSIDLNDGSFQIPVEVNTSSISVEMTVKFKNNETFSKVVVIKGPKLNNNTKDINSDVVPDRISLPFNQVVVGLIMSAIAICLVIGGFIYYLYYHRKPKPSTINFDLNPTIEKVNKVGNPDDPKLLEEPGAKIDMNELKDRYAVENDKEKLSEKKDKSKETLSKNSKNKE